MNHLIDGLTDAKPSKFFRLSGGKGDEQTHTHAKEGTFSSSKQTIRMHVTTSADTTPEGPSGKGIKQTDNNEQPIRFDRQLLLIHRLLLFSLCARIFSKKIAMGRPAVGF